MTATGTSDRAAFNRESSWQEAAPDPIAETTLPSFPVAALPSTIARMVAAVAEFTQTDPAMPGTTALGVLAACAGGRLQVEVRPDWREPVNLYTVTVAAPGERKSAVQAVMTNPLMVAQQTLGAKVAHEIQRAKTDKDIATRTAERRTQEAVKASDQAAALAEAYAAASAAAEITVPVPPRIIADDVTPEAAGSLLADQGGRLAIISAEGGIFDIIAGRYSSIPNLDIWLKGHAGDRLMIDRKGRPAEYIERPAVTVSVMIQEHVLRTVGSSPVMRGRGLLARFLYCLPTSNVGHRSVRSNGMPGAVTAGYATTITDLAIELAEWTDPAVLTLTADSLETLLVYAETIEARMRPGADLAPIADWANKLVGATARIAGLLHVGANPTDGWKTPIGAPVMAAAITLADYYRAHAQAAFDVMAIDPTTSLARTVLDALRNQRVKEFTIRELRRSWVQHRDLGDITAALDLLVDAGWIRPAAPSVPTTAKVGRPASPRFLAHQAISDP